MSDQERFEKFRELCDAAYELISPVIDESSLADWWVNEAKDWKEKYNELTPAPPTHTAE